AADFSVSLRLLESTGREQDEAFATSLRQAHRAIVVAAEHGFDLRGAGSAAFAARGFTSTVEPQMARLDGRLARAYADAGSDGVDSWPASRQQKLELGATALLVALGLASAAVYLLRLAGYRRRLVRQRRAKLATLEAAALSDSLTGLGNH